MSNVDWGVLEAQRPFNRILQEELGQFLEWDGCCCPDCLCEDREGISALARPDRVEMAVAMWSGFFGGQGCEFDLAEKEAIGLRARIQQRFLRELGALTPPQYPT